jgi:hypothetical protein
MATPTAGYSGKTLAAKLGIASGIRVAVLAAPKNYAALLGNDARDADITRVTAAAATRGKTYDIVHLFADRTATLAKTLRPALALVRDGGALWVSWPKKSSPLFVDLTEGGIRDLVLPTGFVDVKVAAVDENWSGLKFLRRRAAQR